MKKTRSRRRRWKRWTYLLIVATVAAGAGWLLLPSLPGEGPRPAGGDVVAITATTSGFSIRVIRAKAGRPLTVELTSLDTRFHTDGGGKHQFAIDALGVNIVARPEERARPRSRRPRPGSTSTTATT